MPFILGFFIVFALSSYAEQPSSERLEKPLILATTAYIPPYVIESNERGIQLSIIRRAFDLGQLGAFKVEFMSNKRMVASLLNGEVDMTINAPDNLEGIYYSEPVLYYENVAVALKNKNLDLRSSANFNGLSVFAFQNAASFLGKDFSLSINKMKSYDEVVNQMAQIDHLMKGWVDVIVIEKRVFNFYLAEYKKTHRVDEVSIFTIFGQAPRPMAFRDKILRDKFNVFLLQFKQSLEYSAMLDSPTNL
ncbi:transporter substrate-binding domain-containing protein [Pseudoalteromonas tunicata]|uniref:substrate-binding periplasmic protein n=1 Tax=Pseudoalteromonas tunicata TaxID=314281 RepID=UPI00273EDF65|nr:transporter substrate-binding domain-containing protein [Pseudoalteromonas tunicata]MDP5213840.1 transporter substrate-binding domain-containing protein [Pseudoalteromonas tunicata]